MSDGEDKAGEHPYQAGYGPSSPTLDRLKANVPLEKTNRHPDLSLPFRVWTLDPHDYQYSHEEKWLHGTYATLEAATEGAQRLVCRDATIIARRSATLEEALKTARLDMDSVWIQGPRVGESGTFNAEQEAEKCVQAHFGRKGVKKD